ncbi:MAG: YfhO family protein [Rugosibacter sp.]|nr:YfhO family protein [Rugosibacter sp.]
MTQLAAAARARPVHFIILLAFGIFLTWPALTTGYVPSRDILIHLLWSSRFSDQLWAGTWYPRWLDTMNGGLGSPVFFFYPPLPYFFTAALKPLFYADPEGWRQLGVAASLAVILSGFGAYGWLRRLTGASAALAGAIVYMGAPYHLATDLYDRFAFAELWSFVWLPLVLWGVQAVAGGSRKAFPGLALAYAALILTHLPTTMIFSPVALAYAIFCSRREVRMRRSLAVAAAMTLGAGLAAVFLLPVLLTQQNISLADMRVGRFSYIYNFLYYGPRFDAAFDADFTRMLEQLGRYAGALALGSLFAFFLGRQAGAVSGAWRARFWLLVAVLSFAMMLPPARPVWDMLPPLQAIQFPWRFNALLTLALAPLIALWLDSGKPQVSGAHRVALWVVGLAVVGQSLLILPIYLALGATPGAASMDKVLVQLGSRNEEAKEKVLAAKLAIDTMEYRPRWAPRAVNDSSQALHATLSRIAAAGPGQGRVSIVSRSPRRMVLEVDMPAAGWARVPHFYYPEWRASLAPGGVPLPIRPAAEDGLIEIQLEAGRRNIVLTLEPSLAEKLGWGLSGFSVLVLGFLLLRLRRSNESAGA